MGSNKNEKRKPKSAVYRSFWASVVYFHLRLISTKNHKGEMTRNPVGAARCAGVRIPPSPPRRRGRHIVRGDFFTKVTSHSFCRGSFPNRNRCAGLAVGRPPCGRCFYDDSGNLNGSGEMDSALAKASPVAKRSCGADAPPRRAGAPFHICIFSVSPGQHRSKVRFAPVFFPQRHLPGRPREGNRVWLYLRKGEALFG